VSDQSASSDSFSERHHFFIRRLHSLLGIVPLGTFVLVHMSVNAMIGAGGPEYQKQVDRIHDLGPLLIPVEFIGIFLPLLFHALLGLKIWFSGRPNVSAYKYGANYRYTFQRISGGVAFVFIFFHLWQMHWLGNVFGGGMFDPHNAAQTTAAAIRTAYWGVPASLLYGIGVLATVYHLANGIWTALITWGITVGPLSQRYAGYICTVFGVLVGLAGLSSIYNFRQYNDETAAVQTHQDTAATMSNASVTDRSG